MISESGDWRAESYSNVNSNRGKNGEGGGFNGKRKIPRRKYAFLAGGRRNLGFPGMVHDKSQEDDRRADQQADALQRPYIRGARQGMTSQPD